MRHLFSTKVRIILVVAALITAALTIMNSVGMVTLPGVITQTLMAPVRAVGTALTSTAELYYSYMFQYEALAAENGILAGELLRT